ncbi:fungal protein kinase-domain containing protein [Phanerochaete sordida]|uniref:Fungal protein kinase-domain containing protein n=1 Tax=Phanerochaete sordida TaxID=48140 RepID=A0A9P3G9L4_9APHY|nr:fungal protein kinase-domain containing protein [Phanerochaete sordida]
MDCRYAEVDDFFQEAFSRGLLNTYDRTVSGRLAAVKEPLLKVKPTVEPRTDVCQLIATAADTMYLRLEIEAFLALPRTNSENRADGLQPDFVLYYSSNPGIPNYTSGHFGEKLNMKHQDVRQSEVLAALEVKASPKAAPLDHSEDSTELPLDQASADETPHADDRDTHTKMAKYVARLCHRQHRCFVLTAFIEGTGVRFMRWDRAGTIVSKLHDWAKDPDALLKFLWCLARCGRSELGFDPTVEPVSASDFPDRRFQQLVRKAECHECLKKYIENAVKDLKRYPWCKVQCPDFVNPTQMRTYYIARALTKKHSSVHGRGTKDYIGFDVERQQIVFVKDIWYSEGTLPELRTYKRLHDHGVQNIWSVAGGGGVGDAPQTTLNQDFFPDGASRPSKRTHHRIVSERVGRPLDTHADQTVLLRCTYDAFLAHEDAYKNAKVLHRDMSLGNTKVDVESGQGFLYDWDVAKYLDAENPKDTHMRGRLGTWPYMSALLLKYPLKPNHLADDLESFLHVLELTAIRFHPHSHSNALRKAVVGYDWLHHDPADNCVNTHLSSVVHPVYFTAHSVGGHLVGSDLKVLALRVGRSMIDFDDRTDSTFEAPLGPLPQLVADWYAVFSPHYKTLDRRAWDMLWGASRSRYGPPDRATDEKTRAAVMGCTLFTLQHEDLKVAWQAALKDRELTAWDAKLGDQLKDLPDIWGRRIAKSSGVESSQSGE